MEVYEKLESLSQTGLWSVIFGQWGHELRMLSNESRVLALWLEEMTDKLVD